MTDMTYRPGPEKCASSRARLVNKARQSQETRAAAQAADAIHHHHRDPPSPLSPSGTSAMAMRLHSVRMPPGGVGRVGSVANFGSQLKLVRGATAVAVCPFGWRL